MLGLVAVPSAAADLADETALAERYAPVVRLVAQAQSCGYGESYFPIDVDALFDEPTVALRGPWGLGDLIEVGPEAEDLSSSLYEYHLDFPGNALDPGCTYERWADRVTEGTAPTVYAHVATDAGHPGQLALQYWFYYVFNDWNNTHEGDWENVQLLFDAADAREALQGEPESVGYSQHEGSEGATWGEDKLELVDGTHPVVYPAAGSHANFFGSELYLGSSAEQGVGCDDTSGPSLELRPVVRTIPSDPADARGRFPWIAFEGRWGEFQPAFFNGPTGPNLKESWTEPIRISQNWRERAYAVPVGGALGTGTTDFFCGAIAAGSNALRRLVDDPGPWLLALAVLLALVALAVSRATWRPNAPLRLARRRAWGQILAAAGRMYVGRAPLFLGIGLVFLPLGLAIAFLQALVLGGFGLLGVDGSGVDASGESAGAVVLAVVTIGTTIMLFGLALVQAATACALVQLDLGRTVSPLGAYRLALGKGRPLLGSIGLAVVVCVALNATFVLAPVALWLAVRWSLLAQVVELEERSAIGALRRSGELVRGRWLRVASLVGVGAALVLAAGPFLGALLIVVTNAPLAVLNIVAAVIYALAMPFVALVTSYVYFDARTRLEVDPVERRAALPAEIQLTR